MKNKQPTSLTRVRLYSHVTKTRFLHVEDALNIGKVRLFAGTYSRGRGMSAHTSHYLDVSDARVVFHALLNGEQGFNYKEYKGTPPSSPKQLGVSRVLSIVVKGDNIYIELKSGPGQLTPTGAITPNGRAQTEVNVSFKRHEARRLAAEALAYIRAWDVCRMLAFQQMVGQPPAYRLSPSVDESDEPIPTPGIIHDEETPAALPQRLAVTPDATRPITCKGSLPKANGAVVKKTNRPPVPTVEQPMAATGTTEPVPKLSDRWRYGDGVIPDSNNALELQTFQRYLAEIGRMPATKAILQAYYRRQMTT